MSKATENKIFEAFIEARMTASEVSSEVASLQYGNNRVDVRLAGGYITKCVFAPDDTMPTTVLYSDSDIALPKINASHVMSPVGPASPEQALGGQHGMYRWTDYEVITHSTSSMTLRAKTGPLYPEITRIFSFQAHGGKPLLKLQTILTNKTAEQIATSLGEHLYWPLPKGRISRLMISPRANPDNNLLCDTDTTLAIADGQSHTYLAPRGDTEYDICFPDGKGVRLFSEAHTFSLRQQVSSIPVGLLLWRRPGTESICFEPAAGLQGVAGQLVPTTQVGNQGIRLNKGASVAMNTAISLLPPE